MDDENIFAAVRGEYLAPERHGLPNPYTADLDTYSRTIEVPEHGLVTITFERFRYRRGRNRFACWLPKKVTRCTPPESTVESVTRADE
ncbi:hypothetical protein CJ010_09770 [Azoarcus sp. DD4]|uniref:hypothetical protein n=1 Tax=Azoarcus sp. DD4 TaxID=2027405 RepID=UPI00112B4B08|nr:hypothetical protein [Azoarcus sp. DD4]QDF96795.1 hypothetical protein CJ010_09770 [Azoarcus sp. DD4]